MTSKTQLNSILTDFQAITKKRENYLTVQDDSVDKAKVVLKNLYDFLKSREKNKQSKTSNTLPELIIQDFDEEQIWQEVDLQNEFICNSVVSDVAHVLAKKERLVFNIPSNDLVCSNEESSDSEKSSIGENSENDDANSIVGNSKEEEDDDEEDGSDYLSDREGLSEKHNFTSEVDDEFFKLSEMENFCEESEKSEEIGKRNEIDLFQEYSESDNEDNQRELLRYNDFFGEAKKKRYEIKNSHFNKGLDFDGEVQSNKKVNKQVQFSDDVVGDNVEDESDVESDHSIGKVSDPKSGFDARQERLKTKIKSLEDEALKSKPWHLQGEASASGRPQNSLLEEFVEFDLAARPAPVFTEKTTLRLEDIIRQRVKDKAWDDVERKIKPVDDIREYRKQLVLNQEKSKLSLAEVYEQEYVKQRDAAAAQPGEEQPEAEPQEHIEINKMMRNLFSKLDALSNFHYTPKPVEPEIKIVSNLPAITMEEVAPVATSDGALLAPEEVKDKKKGELLGQNDRTTTDKKRARRLKKQLQRKKQQEKLKKEKAIDKMSLGLGNKYSKEKAKRQIDQLTKERNVDKMVENQGKHVKSSTSFFSKLEDEVKTQLKRKNSEVGTKKKAVGKFSAKRIKL